MAKAVCPDNVYEQAAYISGFLQATDIIYGWTNTEVDNLIDLPVLQPYTCQDVYATDDGEDCPICSSAC